MCGLRIRPRTDVDPLRVELPLVAGFKDVFDFQCLIADTPMREFATSYPQSNISLKYVFVVGWAVDICRIRCLFVLLYISTKCFIRRRHMSEYSGKTADESLCLRGLASGKRKLDFFIESVTDCKYCPKVASWLFMKRFFVQVFKFVCHCCHITHGCR